jgi:intein/homing endonuclease
MMTLLTLISLFFIPATKSGTLTAVVCPACISVCAVPLNPLCWACLVALCGGATVVTGCFNSDTKIYKMEYGQIKDVPIYELKKNDLVLANNENKFTRVVKNVKSEGIFDYKQIILESGKELTITDEHVVIILDDKSNKRVIRASNLREGQKVITLDGPEVIKKINDLKIKDRYILETMDGTVIANNIYVSTICDDMIDEKMNADDLLKNWKNNHRGLYNEIIKN